ncbi:DUF2889 domain-containing protein [Desulfobacula sp.]
MLNNLIEKKTKIHTRDIQLATYPHTDSQVIVHGVLKDRRYIKVFDVTGDIKEPGIIHHMDVKLLIKSDPLRIEDAQAKMIHVPMPECTATLDTVEQLKGLEIKSGFSKNIRIIMGGEKGCTHLCQLIIAMGQEIVHGWLTQKRKDESPVPKDLESFSEKKFLIDSCRLWTREGVKMKHLEQAIKTRSSV